MAEKISRATDSKTSSSILSKKDQPRRLFFQPKLTIGPTDDVYEQEADATADKVMGMGDHEQIQTKISPLDIQRKCATCEEEEEHAQRKEEQASHLQGQEPFHYIGCH